MSRTRPRVAIVYGFCEGPRIGRKFCAVLRARGFTVVDDAATADIVIGHSGGCFIVPPNTAAKLVVLIGLPHWPGKNTGRAIAQKMQLEMRTHRSQHDLRTLLVKTWWNGIYFWNMRRNVAMWRARGQGWVWRLQCEQTVVVRNRHDTMCIADAQQLPFKHHPILLSMPGLHDDCWRRPDSYIDGIQSVYGQSSVLAQAKRR